MGTNNIDSNEIIPDFIINEPSSIIDKDTCEVYIVKNIVRQGNTNLHYNGYLKKSRKEICLKPLSINGCHMIKDILNLTKSENAKGKAFLPIIDVLLADCLKTKFVIMDGSYTNLIEFFGMPETSYDTQHTFLKHSLRAIKFLHKNGYIHGNLNITSFWIKYIPTKEGCEFSPKKIDEIVLGDLEYCIKTKDYGSDVEVKNISEQRITSKPKKYRYCALGLHKGEKLLELFEKKLPWDKFPEKEDLIRKEKEDMREPTYNFFKRTPELLAEIICFIDKKNPKEIPSSDDIKKRFYNYLKKSTFYNDEVYTHGDSDYTRTAERYRRKRDAIVDAENLVKPREEDIVDKMNKMKQNSNPFIKHVGRNI